MLKRFVSVCKMAYFSSLINTRHTLTPSNTKYHHPLENTLFSVLASNHGVYVHWGVYESGKSTAAKNAGLRLQNERGHTVILLHGYNTHPTKESLGTWLRRSVGVPLDSPSLSVYFTKPTTVIIDHFEFMLKSNLEDTLNEIQRLVLDANQRFSVLLIITSWERAIQLREIGCNLVGSPSRWTKSELSLLFDSLPESIQSQWADRPDKKEELLRLSAISGTPGFLITGLHGYCSPKRAAILDLEWHKGTRAQKEGLKTHEEGRFPDKNGIFHWEDL